jgi:hypothetical protein
MKFVIHPPFDKFDKFDIFTVNFNTAKCQQNRIKQISPARTAAFLAV